MPGFRPLRRRSPLAPSGAGWSGPPKFVGPPPALMVRAPRRNWPIHPAGRVRATHGSAAGLIGVLVPRPLRVAPVNLRHPRAPLGFARQWLYPALGTLSFDLIEAVIAWLESWPPLAAQIVGVWSDEVPRDTPLPYLVVVEVGESAEYSSTDSLGRTPSIDDVQFQISCFAEGKSAARALGYIVEKALNDAPLAFETGYLMRLRRLSHIDLIEPDRGPAGVDEWQRVITFSAMVGRIL